MAEAKDTLQLRVIKKPPKGTRSVLGAGPEQQGNPDFALFEGSGHLSYVCGGCRHVILRNLAPDQTFHNMVFICPGCGAHNETLD